MSTVPSAQKQQRSRPGMERDKGVTTAPITLSERSLLVLALVRIFVGYLWFQQLFWKLPPDFAGLHRYVVREGLYTFVPGYSWIIQHIFLPNFLFLGAGTWAAELLVGISLMLGVFSRFGALLATLLAIQLYVGLAVAPGEWYWTYGMLVLLGVALAAIPAGRRLGIDQWLAPRLRAAASDNGFARLLSWFA
jgi:thiosulfate dehydrogenase [quinone] large subunit